MLFGSDTGFLIRLLGLMSAFLVSLVLSFNGYLLFHLCLSVRLALLSTLFKFDVRVLLQLACLVFHPFVLFVLWRHLTSSVCCFYSSAVHFAADLNRTQLGFRESHCFFEAFPPTFDINETAACLLDILRGQLRSFSLDNGASHVGYPHDAPTAVEILLGIGQTNTPAFTFVRAKARVSHLEGFDSVCMVAQELGAPVHSCIQLQVTTVAYRVYLHDSFGEGTNGSGDLVPKRPSSQCRLCTNGRDLPNVAKMLEGSDDLFLRSLVPVEIGAENERQLHIVHDCSVVAVDQLCQAFDVSDLDQVFCCVFLPRSDHDDNQIPLRRRF